MATERRERKDRQRKRQAILDASKQLIEQKSFDSITMEEIAAIVDISRPALYLYLKTNPKSTLLCLLPV